MAMGDVGDEHISRAEQVTISRAALRLELLEMEVRLKDYFTGRISSIESDIRALQTVNTTQEAARVALAVETERRRLEAEAERVGRAAALEVPVREWSMRASKANVAYALIGLLAFTLSLYAVLLGSHVV